MAIPDYSNVKQVYLEISAGDQQVYDDQHAQYTQTNSFINKEAKSYGFTIPGPVLPEHLTADQQELITSIWIDTSTRPRYDPPTSLVIGKLKIQLFNLGQKAHTNFVALCTGSQGVSKLNKKCALHYKHIPFHRIVSGYIAQSGDVTMMNGCGGDSIYKSQYFNDEPLALSKNWERGTVCYANSGKNKNSSQFFFVLSEDLAKYSKVVGHHVVLGRIALDDLPILDRLDQFASPSGTPTGPVWISDCGIC